MWLSDWGYTNVVEAVYSSQEVSDPTVKVIQKIVKCGKELRKWNWEHFGNVKRELKKKKKKNLLSIVKKEAIRIGWNFQVRELKSEIHDLMDGENKMWFQRSKFCGHPLEIETPNSSIAKLHKEKGKNSIFRRNMDQGLRGSG